MQLHVHACGNLDMANTQQHAAEIYKPAFLLQVAAVLAARVEEMIDEAKAAQMERLDGAVRTRCVRMLVGVRGRIWRVCKHSPNGCSLYFRSFLLFDT